jgi:adenylate cyclase
MGEAQRRLAAILAADVVGYSAKVGADEPGTLTRVRTLRTDLIEPLAATHGGRLFKTTGDGFLVTFASAVQALRCAIAIQDALRAQPDGLRLRIGVHQGEVVPEGDDLLGDGVIVAARLEPLAEPGGICISARVREDAAGKMALEVDDLGEPALKNIAAIRVFRVRLGVRDVGATQPALALPDKPSIAVLAFTSMSGDPEQEYFSDGMAEDIITAMSCSRGLFVIARNSSFTYKGRAVDVKQVGRELGVRYVLEGSVRRGRDRVRISAQLVDAESGNHLWAERYDRDLADTSAVQDEITTAVVLAIGPAIIDAEQQRAGRKRPESLGAWDAYMRGTWHLARQDPAEIEKARSLFKRAIELDHNLSQAYQGLVYSCVEEILVFHTRDLVETRTTVEPLAHRAVALDPSDANAHAALGWVLETEGDHEAALNRTERALALNVNCADAYRLKGMSLVFSGQHRDGCQTLLTHLRLNPRDPGNWRAFHLIAVGCYMLGDYAGAIDADRRAMHENPNQRLSYRWLVAALAQLGRIAEAQSLVRDVTSRFSPEWFDQEWVSRPPWMREEEHGRLLDGLRKDGWQG